ncbi:hypothetical protein HPB52_013147 [Rhipicephalus sanguineus]|uniref:Uncharacterized protein n=1 Tax=Rhipicephalus sanguineus TaxID=34632 RepID=A0A9D4SU02_RHISA|nr:hypothetical protein HPB52_013147 [Rhipicephalus sanguineus]
MRLWILDRPDVTTVEEAAELAEEYASRHASQQSEGRTLDVFLKQGAENGSPKAFQTQRADDENLELLKPFMKECTVNGKRCRVLRDSAATMDVVHSSYVSAKDFTGECAWIRQVVQEHSVCLPLARVRIEGLFGTFTTEAAGDNCTATDSESKRRQQRALQVSAKYPSGQWLLTLVHRDNDTPAEKLL